MDVKSPFTVSLPIEVIERWIKTEGVEDGMMFEHQNVSIGEMIYNKETGYVDVEGDIATRQDA